MSSSSSSSLPTPRQLLTSILNAISEIPPPPTPEPRTTTTMKTDTLVGHSAHPPSNPLQRLDPSHRPLFTTLHVLFPSLLLPALDLLDRGLVTRLAQAHRQRRDDEGGGDVEMAVDGHDDLQQAAAPASSVYVVRSAQKPTNAGGRRRAFARDGDGATTGAGQTSYIVHATPWNCTCAAFAFAAFPLLAASVHPAARSDEGEVGEEEEDDVWGFGGMSFDGQGEGEDEGAVPPCCKHLLACVLAERWAVLGGYVNERRVGREELAGIFAAI